MVLQRTYLYWKDNCYKDYGTPNFNTKPYITSKSSRMGNKRNTEHFFYNLLWNGKNDKNKRTVMINGYEEG